MSSAADKKGQVRLGVTQSWSEIVESLEAERTETTKPESAPTQKKGASECATLHEYISQWTPEELKKEAEEWRKKKAINDAEDKAIDALPVLYCPTCGDFWDAGSPDDVAARRSWGEPVKSPANSRLSQRRHHQWEMLRCHKGHCWWPTEQKAYSIKEAIVAGWVDTGHCFKANKPAFMHGPASADAVALSVRVKEQNTEDLKVDALPIVHCPICGGRWQSHCWDGNRGPLSDRLNEYRWTILECGAGHYWWPTEKKAYTKDQAFANGWFARAVSIIEGIPPYEFIKPVPNKDLFMNGLSPQQQQPQSQPAAK